MAQANDNADGYANITKKQPDEEVNRKNMGDKKFHSESSLQHFGEDEEPQSLDVVKDPGVCTFRNYFLYISIATKGLLQRLASLGQCLTVTCVRHEEALSLHPLVEGYVINYLVCGV